MIGNASARSILARWVHGVGGAFAHQHCTPSGIAPGSQQLEHAGRCVVDSDTVDLAASKMLLDLSDEPRCVCSREGQHIVRSPYVRHWCIDSLCSNERVKESITLPIRSIQTIETDPKGYGTNHTVNQYRTPGSGPVDNQLPELTLEERRRVQPGSLVCREDLNGR